MLIRLLAALAAQDWHTNYAEAVDESKRSEKPLLIFSSRAVCPNCQVMESEIAAMPAIRKLLASFVVVKVDADNEPPATREHLSRITGRTLPFIAYVSPEGKFLGGTSGFRNESQFKRDLEARLAKAPSPPKPAPPKESPPKDAPPPPAEELPPIPDDELEAAFIKAQIKVARECLSVGKKDKAASILRDIIKSNPRSPQIPEAKKLLDEVEKK